MSAPVAVVLVTHDSQRYLERTLQSIDEQSHQPDLRIAVDDRSADKTPELLAEAGFEVHRSTSAASQTLTRIAHNFHHGVRLASLQGAGIGILGDHDDVWRPDRIAHQVGILTQAPDAAMVASSGYLIDEHEVAIPGTIRDAFPVPEDFTDWPQRRQVAYALRHSLATGGASAVRLPDVAGWSIPPGWLHDRWWSLRAVREGRLVIDPVPVIDYRVSSGQEIGMDAQDQDAPIRWWWSKVRGTSGSVRKARDIASLWRG